MSLCIVISTYSTPAFIALQLESAKRFAPGVPVLIYDDFSRDPELRQLANRYGAELWSTPIRRGHYRGDLAAYVAGLSFAEQRGRNYVVKISRRFVPVEPWLEEFREITNGHPPTIGAKDVAFNWYLRTEFIGLYKYEWRKQLPAIANYKDGYIEDFMGGLSKELGPYAAMPFLGDTRYEDNGNFLWYNFATPERYAEQAREWGLDYQPSDFNCEANWRQEASQSGKASSNVPVVPLS